MGGETLPGKFFDSYPSQAFQCGRGGFIGKAYFIRERKVVRAGEQHSCSSSAGQHGHHKRGLPGQRAAFMQQPCRAGRQPGQQGTDHPWEQWERCSTSASLQIANRGQQGAHRPREQQERRSTTTASQIAHTTDWTATERMQLQQQQQQQQQQE
jgi:hypothetical protein